MSRVLLCCGASVSIYKSCDLASKLTQAEHEVRTRRVGQGHHDLVVGEADAAREEHQPVDRWPRRERLERAAHLAHRPRPQRLDDDGDDRDEGEEEDQDRQGEGERDAEDPQADADPDRVDERD